MPDLLVVNFWLWSFEMFCMFVRFKVETNITHWKLLDFLAGNVWYQFLMALLFAKVAELEPS